MYPSTSHPWSLIPIDRAQGSISEQKQNLGEFCALRNTHILFIIFRHVQLPSQTQPRKKPLIIALVSTCCILSPFGQPSSYLQAFFLHVHDIALQYGQNVMEQNWTNGNIFRSRHKFSPVPSSGQCLSATLECLMRSLFFCESIETSFPVLNESRVEQFAARFPRL